MKKAIAICVAALKPRNVFAVLAAKRRGGKHAGRKRAANEDHKDLVQRLREAGM